MYLFMDTEATYLTHRLFRHRCPSTLLLGEYCLQMLDSVQAGHIQHHLGRCPHCRHEIVRYQHRLNITEARETRLEQLRVWIAQRLPPVAATPAYALRGDEAEVQIFSAENGTQVAIDIQPQANGMQKVVGVVIGAEHAIIDLWQAGELHTQTTVNELGNFQIESLKPGDYELIVASTTFLLHIQKLTI